MDNLTFWAQALDNSSPDHLDLKGEVLSPDDTIRRQKVVSLVSTVVKVGSRVFEVRGIQLTADGSHFVVEVPSSQRDSAGRTAPIVCYGYYDLTVIDTLAESVATGLEDFAKRIGRCLQPDNFGVAREAFAALKKKSLTQKRLRMVRAGGAALVLIGLMYWLARLRE